MSQLFASGGQSIGVLALASVLLMSIQDWFPLGFTGWISLQSKGLSRVFSNTTVQKHQFFGTQLSLYSNSHIRPWLLLDQIVPSFFCQWACLQVGSGVLFILVCFQPQICNQPFLSGALLPCSNPSLVTLCCMSSFTERITPVYRIFTLSVEVWDFHMMHNLYLWAHLPQES